jgi:hypothetical protein
MELPDRAGRAPAPARIASVETSTGRSEPAGRAARSAATSVRAGLSRTGE